MKKFGFLQRQILIYSFLMISAILVLTVLAQSYIMQIAREKNTAAQEQLGISTVRQVDSYLEQLMLVATQIAHDSEIVETMEMLNMQENDPEENYFINDADTRSQIAATLANHNELTTPFYRIDVFNLSGDYVSSSDSPEIIQAGIAFTKDQDYRDFLGRVFVDQKRDFILLGPLEFFLPTDLKGEDYIYMEVPIKSYDGSQIYGYVNVYQSLDELYAQIDTGKQTATDVYLCYEINVGELGAAFYPPNQRLPDTSTGEYIEIVHQSNYGIFVVLLQNQAEFLSSYQNIQFFLYGVSFILFVLLFICIYLLVHHTNKPILELNKKVRMANLDQVPKQQVARQGTDEVQELEASFDAMMERMKTSVELEKKAYLKALQAQMNPHFLYNCLSTISSMGVESENEEIPVFCDHLAAILRYETVYEDKAVTLADELQNVRNYLELMKLRYEDDFTYVLDVDESLLSIPMPRLILQPMVENCFEHGFQSVTPPWHVAIRMAREDGQWCISIADNGCGFDEETRSQLRQQVAHVMEHLGEAYTGLKIGGLGLVNTIVRLRLVSGDRLSYDISPNTPTGTIVTLKGMIPDESPDC